MIKTFVGAAENAVQIQIWTSLIGVSCRSAS
jgi:hypothetical protein